MAIAGAPWRQLLLDSLEANKHLAHSKYFQLATVKQNGAPAVRTVVFRGFEEGTNKLMITTDSRTRKVEEIKHCSLGEFVVYLSDSWEQFRIAGHLEIIGAESSPEAQMVRRNIWDQCSSKSLVDFAGPHPRLPVDGELKPPHFDKAAGPLDNFLILTLDPTEVDYYHLKKGQRLIFEKKNGLQWTEQTVNP